MTALMPERRRSLRSRRRRIPLPSATATLRFVADGRAGTPALFDAESDGTPVGLVLEAVERRADDVLWLRYPARARTSWRPGLNA
jgi:hypothetical protein